MTEFAEMLSGGHPNSLGRTEEAVAAALANEERIGELFDTLASEDATVRMRVGDALEKVARERPEAVEPYVERILGEMARIDQPSVQWHVAQLLTEVPLTPAQRRRGIAWLWRTWERSDDWIVISETLTALAHFAPRSPSVRERLPDALRETQRDPRKSVARRATKLLESL
jgi:hypothetical protein